MRSPSAWTAGEVGLLWLAAGLLGAILVALGARFHRSPPLKFFWLFPPPTTHQERGRLSARHGGDRGAGVPDAAR